MGASRTVCAAAMVVAFVGITHARGSTIVSATDTGWYDNTGFHGASNNNYISGSADTYRDFFAFNLSAVSGTVTSASVTISTYLVTGPGTFTLRDVSTPFASLAANQSGATAIFADLGTGNAYGSRAYVVAESNTTQTITLNAAAVADINAAVGSMFAMGGQYAASGGDFVFGVSGQNLSTDAKLNLDVTAPVAAAPLPGAATAGIVLLLGVSGSQIRRVRSASPAIS